MISLSLPHSGSITVAGVYHLTLYEMYSRERGFPWVGH